MAKKAKNRRQNNDKSKVYMICFTIIFVVIFIASFGVGKYPISPLELLKVVAGKLFGKEKTWLNEVELVIFKIRAPRLLAGVLIGGGLAAAGSVYQGVFRNPIVSPDLLGASSGAGFGAALALLFGLGYTWVMLNSFLFGIVAVGVAYIISLNSRQNQVVGMVLAGVMISSIFTAGTSYIKLVSDPNNTLPTITYWLMGSLSNITTNRLLFAAGPILVGVIILHAMRWKINLLTMGDEEARGMGVNTKAIRAVAVLCATLITAACVSISGLIGWVGLVIPHFARNTVGHDYRKLYPASLLLGASFLVLVDNFARSVTTTEIPIGILTAFIGAPFFLLLILKKEKGV